MTHPTHKIRYSDSSLYDEVCTYCGGTDIDTDGRLDEPCRCRPKITVNVSLPPTQPSFASDMAKRLIEAKKLVEVQPMFFQVERPKGKMDVEKIKAAGKKEANFWKLKKEIAKRVTEISASYAFDRMLGRGEIRSKTAHLLYDSEGSRKIKPKKANDNESAS